MQISGFRYPALGPDFLLVGMISLKSPWGGLGLGGQFPIAGLVQAKRWLERAARYQTVAAEDSRVAVIGPGNVG